MSAGAAFDPELAILRELEAELLDELSLFVRSRPERSPLVSRRPARSPLLSRRPARVTRRALALVALVSLVGTSALAGRAVFYGASRHTRRASLPVTLASGGAGAGRWQLQSYAYDARTCLALFAAQAAASICPMAPSATGVRAVSALDGATRLVAGLAGSRVAQLRVLVASETTSARTYPLDAGAYPLDSRAAQAAGLPAGEHWFVATLPAHTDAAHAKPALIVALDRSGRRVGRAVLDCTLGASSSACRHAAARIAAGE